MLCMALWASVLQNNGLRNSTIQFDIVPFLLGSQGQSGPVTMPQLWRSFRAQINDMRGLSGDSWRSFGPPGGRLGVLWAHLGVTWSIWTHPGVTWTIWGVSWKREGHALKALSFIVFFDTFREPNPLWENAGKVQGECKYHTFPDRVSSWMGKERCEWKGAKGKRGSCRI